ncbi:dephospho-CoA kinase [Niabella defluvii]|nr:dephospho-CoA kinase [Niabella sp. I65]
MLRIGLTGGIGSGKTTIANIFLTLGIAIYDADTAARQLMNANQQIRQQLTERFGAATYNTASLTERTSLQKCLIMLRSLPN